jgi:hypothetical protein
VIGFRIPVVQNCDGRRLGIGSGGMPADADAFDGAVLLQLRA